MNYKKYFLITLTILILLVFVFILIPIAFGYEIGFINGFYFSLEEPYYLLSVAVAVVVAIFTYKIYRKQLKLMEEQAKISQKQAELMEEQAKISQKQAELMEEQAKISQKQAELMEQQNKIALFEKRYEEYDLILYTRSALNKIISFTGNGEYYKKSFRIAFQVVQECLEIKDNTVFVLEIAKNLDKFKKLFAVNSTQYEKIEDAISNLLADSFGVGRSIEAEQANEYMEYIINNIEVLEREIEKAEKMLKF